MRDALLKRWFLLLLLGGVMLAWLFPQRLRTFTNLLEVRVVVALALFLIAWCLESRSLWHTFLRPWPALWAITISYGLMPILGWIGGWFFDLEDFRIGLMVIASVPCTLASAVLWTRMAGGNEATALWITLLTTGTSWMATSGWLTCRIGAQIQVETTSVMKALLLVLVLPVALGQLIRAFPPLGRLAFRQKTGLEIFSKILILGIILKAAVDVFDRLEISATGISIAWIMGAGAICLVIHLIGLTAGYWSSRALRFDRANRIAVAFGCSQKSLPVALFLYESYFQDYPLAVIPMAFYHMGQLIVDTLIAERMAEGGRQELIIPPGSEILT
jgi:sodium/bile acid cotransporter 7